MLTSPVYSSEKQEIRIQKYPGWSIYCQIVGSLFSQHHWETNWRGYLVILLTQYSILDSKWRDEIITELEARDISCDSEQDPDLESNFETPLLFYDSAFLLIPFTGGPWAKGKVVFISELGFHLSLFLCFHQKQVTELVGQTACNFSRPVECREEEKQQCLSLLKRSVHLGGHGIIRKSRFLSLNHYFGPDDSLLCEAALCPGGRAAIFWPLSTRGQ